jgi:hypothetical protein
MMALRTMLSLSGGFLRHLMLETNGVYYPCQTGLRISFDFVLPNTYYYPPHSAKFSEILLIACSVFKDLRFPKI